MGWPYFNPPGIQKRTTIEQGNFFVPTDGVEPESVNDDYNPRRTKVIKVVRIGVTILVIAAILVMGYFAISDYILTGQF